jgi:beta-lactamase regulating signal transducer with metallopeptidase domain
MLETLGEAACRTMLLAAAVQFGLWVLRIRRAQLLLVTWTVVLAASLTMPALQWATPLRFPIVPDLPTTRMISVADLQPKAVATLAGPVSTVDVSRPFAIGSWMETAYLVVAGIMLLRLVVGLVLSLRLLSKAVPIRLKSAPNTRVRISPAVSAPVTVGNVILLPPDAVDWHPAMHEATIAHECAHVARWDFALLVMSRFNRALFWFSPVSWLLHRRLAVLAELASDDHAMRVTGDRTGYAEVLLEMGRRSGPLLRGLAMARPQTLQYRIERVLSDRLGPSPVSLLQRSMVVLGAAIVSMAAAGPDFNPGAPPSSIAGGRLRSALARSDEFASVPVHTVNAPPQVPVEDFSRPASRSVAPLPRSSVAALQQPSGVPVAPRPVLRPMVGNTLRLPPARVEQSRSRAIDTQGSVAAHRYVEAMSPPEVSSGSIGDADHSNIIGGAGEVRHAAASQRVDHPAAGEPALLKVIDQQTCEGVYLPSGASGGSGWGPLNMFRAKFFREADGMPWLKLYLNTRDPVNLPVTMTGKGVEFTAAYNTAFTMLPQGTNHLTGTTQRPYGTIDLTCRDLGAHADAAAKAPV